MNKLFFYILLLLYLPVCCSAASLYDKVEKGRELYAQEKYDEALNAFVDAQIEHPEDSRLKFNIASSKYMMKNYEEALTGFLDVAATARDASLEERALYNAGNTLYRQGKLEQAAQYYAKALELDPEDNDARQNLEFVREEIKRRMNEAKKTQQQKQNKDQTCPNPQQQQLPDNQTSQKQQAQQQNEDQKQGRSEQSPQQQAQQQQPSGAAGGKDQQQAEHQSQKNDGDMAAQQAEQLLNSVQENRDNLKNGQQRPSAAGGARTGKDW